MKFCSECNRYRTLFDGAALCLRHTTTDPVRGTRVKPVSAFLERARFWFGNRCGPGGKYWEPITDEGKPRPKG